MRFPEFADEWKQTTLGETCSVIGGGTPSTDVDDYWNGDIQWFTPSEIGVNKFVSRSERTITEQGMNNSGAKLLPLGTILLTTRATIGEASIATCPCTTNQGCQSLVINRRITTTEFVYQKVETLKRELFSRANGSTFKEISASEVRSIPISLPSLAEQEKIASFLSLIDERIQSCSETIKERKREKAALLNQLFSQKLRFPDFDDEWRVTTLGTILSLAPQIPIDKPCIKDIISVKLHGKGISRTSATTLNLGATQYYLRRVGQLIYGKQNFHNGAIALIPKEYDNGITSKDIPSFVFDTTKSSPKYVLAYLLRTKYYEATEVYTTGTGSKRLKEDSFFSLPLSLPSLVEQKKIADFLSLIDERIEVEEELLEQYERQKRYLLRQMFV